MTDAGRNEGQIRCGGLPFQLVNLIPVLVAVHLAPLAAEPAVYGIHIGNEPGQFALIHIIIQIAAIIGGQRELAIGKGAGTAPAGHDIGPTVSGRCRSIPV